MNNTVFVIYSESGSYSDYRMDLVKVVSNKEKAIEETKRLQQINDTMVKVAEKINGYVRSFHQTRREKFKPEPKHPDRNDYIADEYYAAALRHYEKKLEKWKAGRNEYDSGFSKWFEDNKKECLNNILQAIQDAGLSIKQLYPGGYSDKKNLVRLVFVTHYDYSYSEMEFEE